MKHRIVYHTEDGDFETYGTLKEVEGKLPARHFSRCNSCYLINPNYIRSIDGNTVKVGEDSLEISRPKKKNFLRQFNDWVAKGGDI